MLAALCLIYEFVLLLGHIIRIIVVFVLLSVLLLACTGIV